MHVELKCKHFPGLGEDFSSGHGDSVATQKSNHCQQISLIQTHSAIWI